MKAFSKILIAIVLLASFGACLFFYGKMRGKEQVQTQYIQNYHLIKQIAELSSLQVEGSTEFQSSTFSDESWYGELGNLFFGQSVEVRVPYVAKYGIDFGKVEPQINNADNFIEINLPPAKLLSYELKLNQIEIKRESGWLRFGNDDVIASAQSKLYSESRARLENNAELKEKAAKNMEAILKNYFAPSGKDVFFKYDVIQKN